MLSQQAEKFPRFSSTIINTAKLKQKPAATLNDIDADAIAYLQYTSGSTVTRKALSLVTIT